MHISYNKYILVLSCVFFALANYVDGAIGIGVSIVLIVGAKSPNATALLVWMILACLKCALSIGLTIHGIVLGAAVGAGTEEDLNRQKALLGPAFILGVVFVVGDILFQIWVIVVANRARKEIDQGIKI